jgi:hypothetical protein
MWDTPFCENGFMTSLRPGEKRVMAMGDITYEIETMVRAALRFHELDEGDGDRLARNVYLECALLHARNLVEFIATPHGGKYMRPDDFVPGWDYRPWADLKKELGPLNQHLSHLSWQRQNPDSVAPSKDLFREVLKGCEAFRDHLAASPYVGDKALDGVLEKVHGLAATRWKSTTWSDTSALTTSVTEVSVSGVEDPLELRL